MVDTLQNTEIEQIREELAGNTDVLKKVRKYAKGEQGRPLTPEQRRILGRRAANPIADNILAMIIATIASRLDLTGFEVADDGDESVTNFLAELWLRNKMPALQYRVNSASIRDGNHAVSMQWRPATQRVSLHQERWWDGESGIFVAYDDLGDASWAVKEWSERAPGAAKKTIKRRTIYYPDKIVRLIKQGSGWEPFPLPGDPENESGAVGIIPWTRADGTPIGLPVVHFAAESGDDNAYGMSTIAGLLGLQDDINSLQYDLNAAAAFTGFQMYWMSETTDSDELIIGPGRALKGTSANFRAGVLPPGDMSRLIEVHNHKRQSMAIDSSVPIHLITGGDWPSGDALLRAEMPLVDKATRLARQIGPAWVEVAHRATEIGNVFGGAKLDEDRPITAVFAPAERLDEMTRINVDKARVNLYASLNQVQDETLLEKTGLLDKAEITKLMTERTARAERENIGVVA